MFIESLSTDLHFRHLILFKSTVSSGLKCPHGIWMHCVFFSGLCILPHDPQPLKSSIINTDVAESLTRWDHASSIMPGLAALSHVGLNCFLFSLSQFPIFTGDENPHKNHSSEHPLLFNLCWSYLSLNQAPNTCNNSNSLLLETQSCHPPSLLCCLPGQQNSVRVKAVKIWPVHELLHEQGQCNQSVLKDLFCETCWTSLIHGSSTMDQTWLWPQSCSCVWSHLNSFILKALIQTSIWTAWLWWTAEWIITWYYKQLRLSAGVKERENVTDLSAISDLTYRHYRTSLDHHVTGHVFVF